jgi:hypothetical protein
MGWGKWRSLRTQGQARLFRLRHSQNRQGRLSKGTQSKCLAAFQHSIRYHGPFQFEEHPTSVVIVAHLAQIFAGPSFQHLSECPRLLAREIVNLRNQAWVLKKSFVGSVHCRTTR